MLGENQKQKKGRGFQEERIKRYLTDRSRDALSEVNYQLHRGEVAYVDRVCDGKITPTVCGPSGSHEGTEAGQ